MDTVFNVYRRRFNVLAMGEGVLSVMESLTIMYLQLTQYPVLPTHITRTMDGG